MAGVLGNQRPLHRGFESLYGVSFDWRVLENMALVIMSLTREKITGQKGVQLRKT